MEIRGKKILIFGGWGLVGSAICHEILKHSPSKIYISSLRKEEAEEACDNLRKEYKNANPDMFVPLWGNVFTRQEWKDLNWQDVLKDDMKRKNAINDIFNQLDENILGQSALFNMVKTAQPDIVIDCINTATAIAYQNIYQTTENVKNEIEKQTLKSDSIERMMASMYLPQLIRHIQILQKALDEFKVKLYLKIGTAGTGGMGLNIPYTHSEERPSRMLLAKSAVAGAQSLLLFLMARTPDGPIVKEIKPTAAIAWKKIAYDTILRKGKPIPLFDMNPKNAYSIDEPFDPNKIDGIIETGENYKSVFIDTGENGIFSKGEFQAIGALGQMEIVTPEEIAEYAIYEILGGNTGKDIIQGLDGFVLGPTYRGGILYNRAIEKINKLEKENNIDSVAFEMLGPPRLSKLLFEAYLLKRTVGSLKKVIETKAEDLSKMTEELVLNDASLRSEMLSIGLVILLSDGKRYLKGKEVKIPLNSNEKIEITPEKLKDWSYNAWIDLRPSSFEEWQNRIKNIIAQSENIPANDTSSRYAFNNDYWDNFETINEGKLAGWIFENEDKGWRWKR